MDELWISIFKTKLDEKERKEQVKDAERGLHNSSTHYTVKSPLYFIDLTVNSL